MDGEGGGGDPWSGGRLGVGNLGRAGVQVIGLPIGEREDRRGGGQLDGGEEVREGVRRESSGHRAGDGQALVLEEGRREGGRREGGGRRGWREERMEGGGR